MFFIKNKNKGFTLIELLVVVAIIGVLSSVVLTSLNSARAKARDARRMSDIKQIQNAIELYIADNGSAPEVGAVTDNNPVLWASLSTKLVPKYISVLPKDPCGWSSCGGIYGYSSPSSNDPGSFNDYGNGYGLEANLESGKYFIIGNTNGLTASASF